MNQLARQFSRIRLPTVGASQWMSSAWKDQACPTLTELQRFSTTTSQDAPPTSRDTNVNVRPIELFDADFSQMTNAELEDTGTIPGWRLIHSPPRSLPRGALVGTVVSDKMHKTINVAVTRYKVAPKIRKRVRYTRKFMAHDEQQVAHVGDVVMITPCHRLSKHKHFMLREIVRPKGQI